MFDNQDDSQKHKGAKQAVDATSGTSRRQNQNIQIRSKAREGALEKKRRQAGGEPDASEAIQGDPMNPWSYNRNSPPSLVPVALLPAFVQLAMSDDEREVFQGVLLIRKLLAVDKAAPIQQVVDSNVCPRLAQCMQHPNLELQFEASWALSNIASGNAAHANYVIGLEVVPMWVNHLSSPNVNCVEQATWAIGNIAGEGAKCRNYCLDSGAMAPLLTLIQNQNIGTLSLLQSAVWALSNLCRFKPLPSLEHVYPAIPVLVSLLQHSDMEVSLDAVWALSYICDGPHDRVEAIINSGVVPLIVAMLSVQNSKYHMPAIRILGNICAGLDSHTQVAINAGCLPPIRDLLDSHKPRGVRKEAAWTLSNVGAGNPAQIQALIQADLVPRLVQTTYAFEAEVKKEAVWACANIATNGSSQQLSYLVECKVLEAMCDVLTSSMDVKIVTVALETIMTILENGDDLVKYNHAEFNPYTQYIRGFGGDMSIESHYSHTSDAVRELVKEIMTGFFERETVPAAPSNTQDVLGTGEQNANNSGADANQFWNSAVPQGGFNF